MKVMPLPLPLTCPILMEGLHSHHQMKVLGIHLLQNIETFSAKQDVILAIVNLVCIHDK